ncbi:MAG: metallophosphoesterase family protein [Candidatus Omnitrophica bacterium]|nr:metallophosphoesterase family protein [Candidatus Omnitrophota bacterium]
MTRRIALLADVHANLPALQAVIADAQTRSIDEYWNLGDMVGYAPFPNETVALLRQRCARHVLGNHDFKCADSGHAIKMRAAGKDADKVFSFDWTHRELNAESLSFIAQIPRTELVSLGNVQILMTHGSPLGTNDCLTPRTPVDKLAAIAASMKERGISIVLSGHTHEFFDRSVDGVRFINPGGVGRSFDGDRRASYCILNLLPPGEGEVTTSPLPGRSMVTVEYIRVPYPLEELLDAMRARAFPERLVRSTEQARSLEGLEGLKISDVERGLLAAATLSQRQPQEEHSRQVARLAGVIFDQLKGLHSLGWRERAYLTMAALAHDIGWVYGREGHHKASRDLILKDRSLPLEGRERWFVALIARYHRSGLPAASHKIFQDLTSYEQETVSVLAACLRIADGLDRSHRALIENVRVSVGGKRITIGVIARHKADIAAELSMAKLKADLLERIFGLTVVFTQAKGVSGK